MRGTTLLLAVGAITLAADGLSHATQPAAPPKPTRIALIAGPITGHPKHAHEYEKSVILLKHLLDTSPNLKHVETDVHFKGWPSDPASLDRADTIVLISDGADRKEQDHPLYVGDRLAVLERQMKRGCGLVLLHWSTFNPIRAHDQITEWVGGYFDYQSGAGPNKWYSAIQTWNGPTTLASPEHPIARSVKPPRLNEEFYYRIRFRENDARVKPILLTRPPGETQDHAVGWAVERADGGRGFGFTGGHFYNNWWLDGYRKLILNAIAWTAKIEVPAAGVDSRLDASIKALILTGYHHPGHDWRAVTLALMQVMEQDPRMVVDVTENIEDLATEKIAGYDLLVMNYNNWDHPGLSEAAKQGFMKYLKRGGGLAVIHFANGAFTDTLPNRQSDWEEYRTRIVRRIWDHTPGKSGHDAFGPFQVNVTQAKHPITAGLSSFDTIDELYFRQQGELPIEPLAVARSKVTGRDEPLAWAYNYGNGRVFQTVLGHADSSVRKAAALIRRGCVWAAVREQISFDPPRELTEGALVREGSSWTPEQSLKAATPRAKESPAASPTKQPAAAALPPRSRPATSYDDHYGPDAIGFRWSEKDSVDDRWNQTDIGPILASNLIIPGQEPPRKGLSIRVGPNRQATVCFDTERLAMRAGWVDGFLKFDPTRFGIINPPAIAGKLAFASADAPGWSAGGRDATLRYGGLHLHGDRIVLEYLVADVPVRESPWFEDAGGSRLFTRSVQVGPTDQRLALRIGNLGGPARIVKLDGLDVAVVESQQSVVVVAASGDATLAVDEHSAISASIGPGAQPRRIKLLIPSGAKSELTKFPAAVRAIAPADDLAALATPGPARWTAPIVTRGEIGRGETPYVVDTLALPMDNPYKALMFASGHDFFANGDIALCTLHGDVWRISGVDDRLDRLVWKRYATGLFQPLGLKIVNDRVYVLGRDQITRLHDQNGDGEADFYENFNNDAPTSSFGHDFITCLETDAAGNFCFLHAKLGLVRVSADGKRFEQIADGFRNPNGMGVGPGDVMTISPQEGEWTPSSAIHEVRPGGYYGFGGPRITPERPLGYDPPLCWIPRMHDNSSGGQVWVTSDRWGPLGGQLLHFSYGKCRMMLVLRESLLRESAALAAPPTGKLPPAQGGTIDFPLDFLSGAMRGRFREHDGQLYVSGLRGWTTAAVHDGCLQRVRYTGRKVYMPVGFHAVANGVVLRFNEPLEPRSAQDADNYDLEQWNYRWSAKYGSPDLKPSSPTTEGRDPVEVRSATLLADGKSVLLEIDGLQPVMQLAVRFALVAADGPPLAGELFLTLHAIGRERIKPGPHARDPRPGELARDLQDALRPGLIARFGKPGENGFDNALTTRLVALFAPLFENPTGGEAKWPFRARFEGYIRAPLKGLHQFSLTGSGKARLAVNGVEILAADGEFSRVAPGAAMLRRGYNRIEIDYEPPMTSDSAIAQPRKSDLFTELRLHWSGESFAVEPIPPTVLFHDGRDTPLAAGQAKRLGWELFASRRCIACHGKPPGGYIVPLMLPEASADSPALADVGARLRPEWIAHWLVDPRAMQHDATMPRMFADSDEGKQQAADVAAHLASLGKPAAVTEQPPDPQLVERGEVLYEDLSCIACHTLAPPERADKYARNSLYFAAAKYQPGQLAAYLLKPSAHYQWTRMPDFHLTADEAGALAAYLRSACKGKLDAAPPGNAKRGKELLVTRLCVHCHKGDSAPEVWIEWLNTEQRFEPLGCMAEESAARGVAPDLQLSRNERQAIKAIWKEIPSLIHRHAPAETADRMISTLRCNACHTIDGRVSPRGEIIVEEGAQGLLPDSLPTLTWSGEKLRADWTERLLAGKLEYRTRPWLKARMPSFGPYARAIAHGLAVQHGISPYEDPPRQPQLELVETGRKLSLSSGLDCRQCHGVGPREPEGDKATHVALGPNFDHVRERLRFDYYQRWMRDPLRIEPGTKMPQLAPDGRRTKARQFYGGDAERQFMALWHYIESGQW